MIRVLRSAVVLGWLSLAAVVGCGGDGKLSVYPVSGTVLLNGKPLEGASVCFYPKDEAVVAAKTPLPQGTTDASGKFQLKTYEENDGAPAGEYGVSIVRMEVVTDSDDPEQIVERDRLKGKYADVDQAGLTATVQEDATEVPAFDLK